MLGRGGDTYFGQGVPTLAGLGGGVAYLGLRGGSTYPGWGGVVPTLAGGELPWMGGGEG